MGWIRKDKVKENKAKVVEPKVVEKVVEEIKEPEVEEEPEQEVEEVSTKTTWSVIEVTTQTQPLIYNSKTNKQLTLYEAVVELLNRTED